MDRITEFWNSFFGGLPDVVVAILVLILALVVAQIAKKLVLKLVDVAGLRKACQRAGIDRKSMLQGERFLGKLTYFVVFLLFLPGIFEKLGLNNVAQPIMSMMNSFLVYLPNIIGGVIIVMIGVFVAQIVREILKPVLNKINLNGLIAKTGIDTKRFNVVNILAGAAYVVIIVFFIVEGLNTLQLDVLTRVGNSLISYLPNALSAALVLLVAYLGGSWAEQALARNFKLSGGTAMAIKVAIITLGVFMALTQLGVASEIVRWAFIIVLGAVGVAFAIAFGIGGKGFAERTMRKVEKNIEENERRRK